MHLLLFLILVRLFKDAKIIEIDLFAHYVHLLCEKHVPYVLGLITLCLKGKWGSLFACLPVCVLVSHLINHLCMSSKRSRDRCRHVILQDLEHGWVTKIPQVMSRIPRQANPEVQGRSHEFKPWCQKKPDCWW